MHRSFTLALVMILSTSASHAQSLASRVAQARNGNVRFTYASRPDVCGSGENMIQSGEHNRVTNQRDDDDRNCPCEYGPVRLTLEVRDGAVTRVRTAVGGRSRGEATDLGTVGTRDAVAYLFLLARGSNSRVSEEALFPITLADSVTPWPEMLRLAKAPRVGQPARKASVFWLGQAAGDAATAGLTELAENDEDREVKEAAVFALSQLHDGQGVPALIRIARTNRDPRIRRTALFWLGQSDDPRALQLFEELLTSN